MSLSISKQEQEKLLSKRNKIPPKELREQLSPEGQELWDKSDFEYSQLHTELETYFRGLPSQLQTLDEEWRDYLEAKQEWFLSLYNLVRKSWNHLTPYHKDKNGNNLTPGQVAADILEADCKGGLIPAIARRAEIAPRRNYELSAKLAKAKHKGEREVERLFKKYRGHWGEFYQAATFEVAVISYCRAAATHDKWVKDALKDYISAVDKLDGIIRKQGEYAKRKQEIWNKGKRETS